MANQLYNRFAQAKHRLNEGDIAVLDAAEYHHYQVECGVCIVKISYNTTTRLFSQDGEEYSISSHAAIDTILVMV